MICTSRVLRVVPLNNQFDMNRVLANANHRGGVQYHRTVDDVRTKSGKAYQQRQEKAIAQRIAGRHDYNTKAQLLIARIWNVKKREMQWGFRSNARFLAIWLALFGSITTLPFLANWLFAEESTLYNRHSKTAMSSLSMYIDEINKSATHSIDAEEIDKKLEAIVNDANQEGGESQEDPEATAARHYGL